MSIVDQFKIFLDKTTHYLAKGSNAPYVANDGTSYPKRESLSAFLEKLQYELADPEKAQRIYKGYQEHLAPFLTVKEKAVFEAWLLKNIRFMGAIPFFVNWNDELASPIKSVLKAHLANVKIFFESISLSEKPTSFPVNRNPNDPKNIVIITTCCGGGHKSVADSLEQILNRFPDKYKVTVVDVASVFKPSDPLYRLSGLLSAEEIYDKIYQQCNEPWLAQKLWELKPKLNNLTANRGMQDLKDRIKPLNPDLVISTCHFLDRDLELASALDVPLRFAHCDYELSWALVPLLAKVNPEIVKLWLPATDPELLKPVSSMLKSELVEQLSVNHSDEEVDQLIQEKERSLIEYSGYPVRSSFVRESDPAVLKSIRERFHVAEDAQVVTIQMGRQGVGTMTSVVKALNENHAVVYDHPLHIAVMCGKNESMRTELLKYLETYSNNHPQIHFDILPFMEQQDTADWLKITDVELMKPGGAATSEALELGVNTLIFVDPAHPWEGCNKDQMLRHGIGTLVESLQSIPVQLKEVLKKPKELSYEPIKASEMVPKLVDEAIATFQVFKKQRQLTLMDSLEISNCIKGFRGNKQAHLIGFLSKKYPHLSFEMGSSQKVDQKIKQLHFIESIRSSHGLSHLVIPKAIKVDVSINGIPQALFVQQKVERGQKTSELPSAALKQLVTLITETGLEGISYADLEVSNQEEIILNLEKLLSTPTAEKKDPLTSLHSLLRTLPKTEQKKVLDQVGFRTEAIFDSMDPEEAGILYDMLSVMDKIFQKHGITYWGCSGTLLGVARNHKGIIPWDDDIDTEVFEKDRSKILALNDEFKKHGYQLIENELGLKIVRFDQTYPGLDIFFAKEENGKYYFADPAARKYFPREYWLKEELAQFERVPFGPTTIPVPKTNLNRHLSEVYGKDWSYVAYRIWDHANNRQHTKEKVYLTQFDQVKYT